MEKLALTLLLITAVISVNGKSTLENFFDNKLYIVAVAAGGGGLLLIIIIIILVVVLCRMRAKTRANLHKLDLEMVMPSNSVDSGDGEASPDASNGLSLSSTEKKSPRPLVSGAYTDIDLPPQTSTEVAANSEQVSPQINGTNITSSASSKKKSRRPPVTAGYTDIDLPFTAPTEDHPVANGNQENGEAKSTPPGSQQTPISTSADSRPSEVNENTEYAEYAKIVKPRVTMVENDLYGTNHLL